MKRTRLLPVLLVSTALTLTACDEVDERSRSGERIPIPIAISDWTATAREHDPFTPVVGRVSNECSAWQPVVEGSILEFSTRACAAMTVEIPLGVALPAGTRLEVSTTHAILLAEAPSTGWLGVAVGEDVVVTRHVPIPSDANAYLDEGVLPRAAAADHALRLHVSNHGPNSWRFVTLTAVLP